MVEYINLRNLICECRTYYQIHILFIHSLRTGEEIKQGSLLTGIVDTVHCVVDGWRETGTNVSN